MKFRIFFFLIFIASAIQAQSIKSITDKAYDYCENNQTDKALALVKEAFEANKKSDSLAYFIGLVYNNYIGKYQIAAKYFDKAVEINPAYVDAYVGLGISYAKVEDFFMAEAALKTALDLDPALFDANYNLGHLYYLMGRYKEKYYKQAIPYYSSAMGIDESYPLPYLERGVSLFYTKEYTYAGGDFQSYKEMVPAAEVDSLVYLYSGLCHFRMEAYDLAVADLRTYLEKNDRDTLAWDYLVHAYIGNLQPDSAFYTLQQLEKSDYHNTEFWYQTGVALKEAGDIEFSLYSFNKAADRGHRKALNERNKPIEEKYYALTEVDSSLAVAVPKHWKVDVYVDKPELCNLNGVVFYDQRSAVHVGLFGVPHAVQPRQQLVLNGHVFSERGKSGEVEFDGSGYYRKISADVLKAENGKQKIEVHKLIPKKTDADYLIYIWGAGDNLELFGSSIDLILTSVK